MEIVVGVSSGVINSVLSLIRPDSSLTFRFYRDIIFIRDKLACIQALIKIGHDEWQDDMLKQLRDLAYDVEDFVVELSHHLDCEPSGSGRLVYLRKVWYLLTTLHRRHSMAAEIGDLKIRMEHLSDRCKKTTRYTLDLDLDNLPAAGNNRAGANTPRDRPPPRPQLIGTTEPVGMEDAISELEKWFSEGKESIQQRLLAIVGFGGLGKTTLAMALYRKFGDEFDCRASVLASQRFHLQTVLRNLVRQFHVQQQAGTSQDALRGIEKWGTEVLRKKLADLLQHKRYYILIDDIWSVSAWENIRDSLPKNDKGGSIVVTTRFKSVAEACRLDGQVYEHRPLSEKNSYKLFRQIITCAPDESTDGATTFLRKCGGLPLAIILVAGFLDSKLNSDANSEVLDNHLFEMGKKFSDELANNVTMEPLRVSEGLTRILNHCYNHLPSNLKTCLLYLTMFPKGCWISRKRLIRKWTFAGFIAPEHGKIIEEVAEDCFNELIGRNLIRPINYSSNGKVKSCQIHDIVLEYIVTKSSDENFITVIGGHWQTPSPSYSKVRLLSVIADFKAGQHLAILQQMDLSRTRSLVISCTNDQITIPLHEFTRLRILDLAGWENLKDKDLLQICKMFMLKHLSIGRTGISKLPPQIKELRYLRTLDISRTNISELPLQVCELKFLWMLDLRGTQINHLPDQIVRLKELKHFFIGSAASGMINFDEPMLTMIPQDHFRILKTVETIGSNELSISSVLSLGYLQSLAVLAITWSFHQCIDKAYQEALRSCMERWKEMKSLTIHCGLGCSMDFLDSLSDPPKQLETFKVTAGRFLSVPQWVRGFEHLTFLQITVCRLVPDDVKILADLVKLDCLILSLEFIPEEEMVIESKGFKELQFFSLDCAVPWLTFNEGAMPKLTCMKLKICSGPANQLSHVPSGLAKLQRISEVVISYSKRCSNSSSIKMTVKAVKEQAVSHPNAPIHLVINGRQENIEALHKATERATRSLTKDDLQLADEEIARKAERIQSEIEEIEGEIEIHA